MSTVVDERIVEMQFDNAQFEKGVHQSISTLNELKNSLEMKKASKGLLDFRRSVDSINVSGLATGFTNGFNKISLGMMALYSTVDYYTKRIISRMTAMVKSMSIDQVVAGWEKYAEKTTAVQSIMSATRQEMGILFDNEEEQLEIVESMMYQLNRFSDETSYSFSDMASNIGKFTSVGVSLDNAAVSMEGIALAAAAAGQNSTGAARAMYQLSQAMGQGSLKLMDWKSIENLNMATVEFKQALIDAGVAQGTLKKKIKNGVETYMTAHGRMKVTTENFRETLVKGWATDSVMTEAFRRYGDFATRAIATLDEWDVGTATILLKNIKAWKDGTKTLDEISADLKQPVDVIEEEFYRLTSFAGKDNTQEVLTTYAERYKMRIEDLGDWVSQYLEDPKSFGKEDWAKLSEITGQSVRQLQKDFKSMKKNIHVETMDTYAEKFGMSIVELGEAYKQYKAGTLDFNELNKQTGIGIKELQKDFAKMAETDMEIGMNAMFKGQEAKTFKESIDATKEAVATGWMNISQALFGNYLEATKLWTGLSEALWTAFAGQFGDAADRINEVFQPFRDDENAVQNFVDSLANIADIINTINGVFVNSLLDVLLPESGQELIDWSAKFKETTDSLKESLENSEFLEIFGNSLKIIFNLISKAGSIVWNILNSIGKTISSLFKKKDTKNGKKLADILGDIAEKIKNFEIPESVKNGFNKFLSAAATFAGILFKGLGAVWNIIKVVAGAIGKLLGPVVKTFGEIITSLFDKISNKDFGKDFSLKKAFLSLFKSEETRKKVEKFIDDIQSALSDGLDGMVTWIKDKMKEVKEAILGAFKIGSSEGEGEDSGELSSETVEKTEEKVWFITRIINAVKNLTKALKSDEGATLEDSDAEKIGQQLDIITRIYNAIAKFINVVTFGIIDETVLEAAKESVKALIIGILDFFKAIGTSLSSMSDDYINEKDINKLTLLRAYFRDIIGGILAFVVIMRVSKAIKNFSEWAWELKDAARKALRAWKQVQIAKMLPAILKSFATLIATIVAAIVVLSLIPSDKIDQGLTYMTVIIGEIVLFFGIMVGLIKWLTSGDTGNAAKDALNSLSSTGSLVGAIFAFSILLLSIGRALTVIAKLSPDEFWRAAGILGGFLVVFAVIFGAIYALSNQGKNKKMQNAVEAFGGIGKAISKIALSFMLIALSLAILGAIPILFLVKALATIIILGVVFGALAFVNNITTKVSKKGKNAISSSDVFINMAHALLAAAAAIILLAAFGPNDPKKAFTVIAEIGVMMLMMVMVFNLLASNNVSMLPAQIKQINKTIAIFSGFLVTVALVLIAINKWGPSWDVALGYLAVFAGFMLVMAAAIAIIMAVGKLALPQTMKAAGKTMFMMAGSLIVIGLALKLMSSIDFSDASGMDKKIEVLKMFFKAFAALIIILSLIKFASADKIKSIGAAMLALSGSLAIIAIVMKILNGIVVDDTFTGKIEQLAGLFLEMGIVLGIISALKDADPKKIMSVSKSMLLMSGVFVVLAFVMRMMWKIPYEPKKLGWLAGLFGGLALTMIILSAIKPATPKKLKTIATSILLMSVVLYSIAGAMALINTIDVDDNKSFAIKMGLMIASFAALAIALGLLSKKVKGGKAMNNVVKGLLALSGSLLIVAISMKLMENVPWQTMAAAAGAIILMAIVIGILGAIATGPVGAGMIAVGTAMLMLSGSILMLSLAAIGFGAAVLIFVVALNMLGETWEKNGEQIQNAIKSLIALLPELGTAFGQFIANFLTAIAQGIIDMLQIFIDNRDTIESAMYELASAGIKGFAMGMASASEAIANSVVQIIAAICTAIIDYSDMVVMLFQGVIVKTANGIIELSYLYTAAGIGLATGLVGGFMKAVGEKLNGTALGELFGIGDDWIKKGEALMESAKLELPDGFEEAYNQAKALAEGLNAGKSDVKEASDGIAETVKGSFKNLFSGGEGEGESVFGNLFGGIFGGGEGGFSFDTESIKTKILGALSFDNLGIDKSQFDLSKYINVDGMEENISTSGVEEKMNTALMVPMSNIGKGGGQVIAQEIASTLETDEQIPSTLETILGSDLLSSLGSTGASAYDLSLAEGLADPSEAKKAIDDSAKEMEKAVKKHHSNMKTAGHNLMRGLTVGINEGSGSTIDAVRRLAERIKNAVQNSLEINSPSHFTERMGLGLDEGLVLGIREGTKSVLGASNKMTSQLTDSFSAAVQSAYDMLDSSTANGPVIRPVVDMSDVTAKAQTLGDVFNQSLASSVDLAANTGSRASASITQRTSRIQNGSQNNSNNVTLYIDGIKYNTDDYIDSSITGFVESMVRRGQMYGRA